MERSTFRPSHISISSSSIPLLLPLLFLCLPSLPSSSSSSSFSSPSSLSLDYYRDSCPRAEQIIHSVMVQKQKEAFVTAAGTLRIFFHDCFVTGCDASVMVASTAGNRAEKDAAENLSLPGDGFDAVMRAKAAVEEACPGIVSCADVLAIATRDLVGLVGGPFWQVLKGRKDGRVSSASLVPGNLPRPTQSLDELAAVFARKGFTRDEMVVLSGGHTIGFSHCDQFTSRVYGPRPDPTLNATYAAQLRASCPATGLDPTVVMFNDVSTPRQFDNAFFSNLRQGLGLLASDQVLWTDPRTRGTVSIFAASQPAFFHAWARAMNKLSLVGVLTGSQGEVRRHCDAINPLPPPH